MSGGFWKWELSMCKQTAKPDFGGPGLWHKSGAAAVYLRGLEYIAKEAPRQKQSGLARWTGVFPSFGVEDRDCAILTDTHARSTLQVEQGASSSYSGWCIQDRSA